MNAFIKYSIVIGLFLSVSMDVHANRIIKVRVNDMPPQYIFENGKWRGYAVEMMEVLLDEAGLKAEFVSLPWARALIELESGRIDALMNVNYSSERAKKFHFIWTNSYEIGVLIVRKKSDYSIDSLDDFKLLPGQIGVERGNIYNDKFNEKVKNDEMFRNIFYPMSNSQNIPGMIQKGRLIGALGLLLNAKYKIKTDPEFVNLKVHPFYISKTPSFFAFSRKSVQEHLLRVLRDANIRAVAKGGYDKVIRKWKGDGDGDK